MRPFRQSSETLALVTPHSFATWLALSDSVESNEIAPSRACGPECPQALEGIQYAKDYGFDPDVYGKPIEYDCVSRSPADLGGEVRVESFSGIDIIILTAFVNDSIKEYGKSHFPEIILYDRNESEFGPSE